MSGTNPVIMMAIPLHGLLTIMMDDSQTSILDFIGSEQKTLYINFVMMMVNLNIGIEII